MRIGESMKKKVVHLVYSMGCGGLEKVIVNLINGSYDEVEHIIISLTPEFEMTAGIIPDIQIFCLDKKPGKDIGCHFRLYKLLKQLSPDAINTYNFGTIEYHVTAFLAGVKTRVHSDHGHGGDAQDGLNKKNNFIRKISSYFIDDYVVVSQDLMDWVTQVVKVKPGRRHLIQNGVEVPKQLFEVKGSGSGIKTISTVGRLDPVKNQALLLKAFKRVLDNYPSARLKIVGDGSEKEKLTKLAQELSITSTVDFLGYREDVKEQLVSSDVFVLSSHYEAMPMTILEAMAVGVPVVTTDVGGIRHFIDERYAYFVTANSEEELAKSMCEALFRNKKTEDMILNSYNLVKRQYSIEAMISRYKDIYLSEKNRD